MSITKFSLFTIFISFFLINNIFAQGVPQPATSETTLVKEKTTASSKQLIQVLETILSAASSNFKDLRKEPGMDADKFIATLSLPGISTPSTVGSVGKTFYYELFMLRFQDDPTIERTTQLYHSAILKALGDGAVAKTSDEDDFSDTPDVTFSAPGRDAYIIMSVQSLGHLVLYIYSK